MSKKSWSIFIQSCYKIAGRLLGLLVHTIIVETEREGWHHGEAVQLHQQEARTQGKESDNTWNITPHLCFLPYLTKDLKDQRIKLEIFNIEMFLTINIQVFFSEELFGNKDDIRRTGRETSKRQGMTLKLLYGLDS